MDSMGAHDQQSKYLQVSIPDYNFSSETHVNPTQPESTSLSSKMKRMLASPKVSRGKAPPNPNKIFGVPLEHLTDRDKAEVPLIVTRICEYLRAQGFRQEGLFRVNGNMKVVERLKNAFDKCGGANLEEIGDVPAAASLLKMFLRELTEPVIPEDLQPVFIQVQDQYCKQKDKAVPLIKELIRKMPKDNAYLLKYLCEFMLAIADGSDLNKMTPLALAIVFGPNIFRCGEGLDGLRDQAYVNAVLLLILQEYEEMFLIDNDKFPDSKPRVAPEKPIAYFDAKKAKTEGSSKTAPARPPPPKLGLEQETLVSLEKSSKRTSSKSPRRSSRRKSPNKSPRQEQNNKQRAASKKKNKKDAERSSSPSFSSLSSPLSKQLVVNTISTAVKEHLFGPDMLISSTESETQDNIQQGSAGNSHTTENYDNQGEHNVYPSVKERVKKFSVEASASLSKKQKSSSKSNDRVGNPSFARSFSIPSDMRNETADTDFDFIKSSGSTNKLEHLTVSRPQPPANRRRPASYVRSENDSNNPLSSASTTSDNRNGDYDTIYSDKIVLPTYNTRDSPSYARLGRRKQNEWNADATINSLERLNILQQQDEGRETEIHKASRSYSGPPSPNDNHKQMWREKRQDTLPIHEMSSNQLKKKISALKKTISNFETDFMEAHGRKPKPSEKTQIQKYVVELGRAKKHYRELLNDFQDQPEMFPDTAPAGPDFETAPNFREIIHRDTEPTKEQTLSNLLRRLEEKRSGAGRPHEILAMSPDQLKDEKLAVQKSLLQYENQHGRPSSKEDKILMRPIYDRYRKIKRLITVYKMDDAGCENETIYDTPRTGRTCDLPSFEMSRDEMGTSRKNKSATPRDLISTPTAEYYTIVTVDDETPSGTTIVGDDSTLFADTFSVTNRLPYTPEPFSPPPLDTGNNDFEESVLHEASLNELMEQLKDTKNAKKRLGKILKDFEDDFFVMHDRKVQKEDRLPMEAEYREYKLIKAKLRLVEALIAKKKKSTESM